MTPKLNRRLTLSSPVRVPDGAGGYSISWNDLGQLWASVAQRGTGRVNDAEGILASLVHYKITVRAAPMGSPSRPNVGQRFLDGTRVFRILAVSEADSGARYLTCFAEEEEAST